MIATRRDQAAVAEPPPVSLLVLRFHYRDLEDAERRAIARGDFATANRALSRRLAVKARLLLLIHGAKPGRS